MLKERLCLLNHKKECSFVLCIIINNRLMEDNVLFSSLYEDIISFVHNKSRKDGINTNKT